MYRVELKERIQHPFNRPEIVPNVPCGVESSGYGGCANEVDFVPNVPCGVERQEALTGYDVASLFLMYRVELKARCAPCHYGHNPRNKHNGS